jgi:hypothetical protein
MPSRRPRPTTSARDDLPADSRYQCRTLARRPHLAGRARSDKLAVTTPISDWSAARLAATWSSVDDIGAPVSTETCQARASSRRPACPEWRACCRQTLTGSPPTVCARPASFGLAKIMHGDCADRRRSVDVTAGPSDEQSDRQWLPDTRPAHADERLIRPLAPLLWGVIRRRRDATFGCLPDGASRRSWGQIQVPRFPGRSGTRQPTWQPICALPRVRAPRSPRVRRPSPVGRQ